MKHASRLYIAFALLILSIPAVAQESPSGVDHYIHSGKTIFIAKCVTVGPVNILLRAVVDLEVIHVVKGAKLPETLSVVSQFGMEEGKTYLLKSEDAFATPERRLFLKTRDSVIPVQEHENMSELLSLPPRIVVLRTMNRRVHHLEHKISVLSYELEALKLARKD